jgi:hypothetical protein
MVAGLVLPAAINTVAVEPFVREQLPWVHAILRISSA